jgi:hypothetical protein
MQRSSGRVDAANLTKFNGVGGDVGGRRPL